MPTVSLRYDIKSLIEQYAPIQYANKGRPSTSNNILEYHSNCPWCPGSKDSFIMRPELGDYSHAIRTGGCGRHGDCLDFLKEYCNMSHREACEILGLEYNADFVASAPSSQIVQSGKEDPPNKMWQESGKNLIERAARHLWSPAGKEMLDYLHARGLGDEIIKKKKLGYVPRQQNNRFYESSLEDWGLDPETCSKDKVRVPNGILIPWFDGSDLWRLAVKRIDQPKGQDYIQVVGSKEGLYNVSSIQWDMPVMMVEGEICCMSVEQECGDLVSCVATGSTTLGRLNRWVAELHLASYILQSFDEDAKGDIGAEYWAGKWDEEKRKYCPGVLEKGMRWSPLVAKDPNDILLKKFFSGSSPIMLRAWVEAGIHSANVEFGISKPVVFKGSDEEGWKKTEAFPIPLARGKTLNELVQERRREKDLPPQILPSWTQKEKDELRKSFAHVQVVGPEIDLNAQTIQDYAKSHLVAGICLDKDCPCQEVWGNWVLERAQEKGRAPKKKKK